MIFFRDERSYNDFTSGNFEFGAQATAVALRLPGPTLTLTT